MFKSMGTQPNTCYIIRIVTVSLRSLLCCMGPDFLMTHQIAGCRLQTSLSCSYYHCKSIYINIIGPLSNLVTYIVYYICHFQKLSAEKAELADDVKKLQQIQRDLTAFWKTQLASSSAATSTMVHQSYVI